MSVDPFTKQLDPGWRWPIGNEPAYVAGYGSLRVHAAADGAPVFLARSLTTPASVSTVRLDPSSAAGGLGVLGGVHTKLVISHDGVHLALVREAEAKTTELWSATVDAAASVWLCICCNSQCLSGLQLQQGWHRLGSDHADRKHRPLSVLGPRPAH